MPELPDVEAKRRYLQGRILNQRISRVEVNDRRVIRGTDFARLKKGVVDKKFTSVERIGKYLILMTDGSGTLLFHFGLTGDVIYQLERGPLPRFFHAIFYMDDHALYFSDQRKFGRIAFYETQNLQDISELRKLGPEPLAAGFDYSTFNRIIKRHDSAIHEVLMMQEEIAGIGNIYADEICFQAGVKPDRSTRNLSDEEIRRLFDATKSVLQKAIEMNADLDPLSREYIIPHRHTDNLCPKGNEHLETAKIGGRTSYYCPSHQR